MPVDNSTLSTLLMLALMAVAFWLLLIRPAQRKQKAQQQLVAELTPGSRIMTTAGIMGTVRHMGTSQAIIEISPGVEMTILKQAIMRTVTEAEEEFEYDEADSDAGQPVADAPDDQTGVERPTDPDPKTH